MSVWLMAALRVDAPPLKLAPPGRPVTFRIGPHRARAELLERGVIPSRAAKDPGVEVEAGGRRPGRDGDRQGRGRVVLNPTQSARALNEGDGRATGVRRDPGPGVAEVGPHVV